MSASTTKKFTLIENLDRATRKYTAFISFREMVLSCLDSSYRPTLYVYAAKQADERKALKFLADYYDMAMQCLMQERRAFRV